MSAFMIYQKLEYAVMLSDMLGTKKLPETGTMPLNAPKMVRVAPHIFAVHAGRWQPALEMLHGLYDFVTTNEDAGNDDILEFMAQAGPLVHEKYQEKWSLKEMDIRIALVVTGPYRFSQDVENGTTTSMIIWESPSDYQPRQGHVVTAWAANNVMTDMVRDVLRMGPVQKALNAGPLSATQALNAVHALVAGLNTSISMNATTIVVGADDSYSVLNGTLIELPNPALIFG